MTKSFVLKKFKVDKLRLNADKNQLIEDGKTGRIFKSGSERQLKEKILELWKDRRVVQKYSEDHRDISYDTLSRYCDKVMGYYK